ncbi:MAG: hypothetical protein ACRELY_20495 [Polyangiaceae bacterium]
MIEGPRRKPPYVIITIAALVSVSLTYATYEVSIVGTVSGPTKVAADRTVNALDPNGADPSDKKPELPVWPPPSATQPVDPASNPMTGALPTRIDWPNIVDAAAAPRPPKP